MDLKLDSNTMLTDVVDVPTASDSATLVVAVCICTVKIDRHSIIFGRNVLSRIKDKSIGAIMLV